VPNSKSFAYHLTRHCRRLGVDIRLDTTTRRLLQEDGRIVGVETETADKAPRQLRARGGVVLASGDYSGARDLKARLASPEVVEVEAVNAASTGDGHRMALEVGATVVNGDIVRGPIMRFVPPARGNLVQKLPPARPVAQFIAWSMSVLPQWILRPFLMSFLTTALGPSPDLFKQGALLINNRGQRFTDELDRPAYDIARQPGRIAYIVFDHALASKFSAWPHFISTAPEIAYAYVEDYLRLRRDVAVRANTLSEIARLRRIPERALSQTVQQFRRYIGGSGPDPFGRTGDKVPLQGP